VAHKAKKGPPTKSLEQRLFDAAAAPRGSQEPSQFRHVVFGLVFLKYISDRFEAHRQEIGVSLADLELPDYVLVVSVRQGATIDWNVKDSVQAAMRAQVRRLLAKCDYPPDLDERAVELVLEQAEVFATGVSDEAA
jgi:Domain of unknown function (DUF3387)/HsdM N-terminal domain